MTLSHYFFFQGTSSVTSVAAFNALMAYRTLARLAIYLRYFSVVDLRKGKVFLWTINRQKVVETRQ